MAKSRYERLLEALLKGETTDIIPKSRMEAALKNCVVQCGADGLPEPQSASEAYLQALASKMRVLVPIGTPVSVATEAAMDEVLTNATDEMVGTFYLYEGETTENYESGALYIIEKEV